MNISLWVAVQTSMFVDTHTDVHAEARADKQAISFYPLGKVYCLKSHDTSKNHVMAFTKRVSLCCYTLKLAFGKIPFLPYLCAYAYVSYL